ncbi:MAG: sulfatase family protein [Candidatus Geothermincolia bacterium]
MASEKKPPNVLMIIVDNQWAGALGCYGNTEHHTPNLDLLARQGMRFSRGYATNGLCSPTRASILTGLMPSQHGTHMPFNDDLSYLPEEWTAVREFRTLPLTLKNRGYQTAHIGKWHLGQYKEPKLGFEHWVVTPKGHTSDFYHSHIIDNGKEYDVNDQHLVDFWAEKASEYLENYTREKPFYLQVAFNGPYVMPPTALGPDPRNPFYEKFENVDFKPLKYSASDRLLSLISSPYDPNADQEITFSADDIPAALKVVSHQAIDYVRMQNDPATRANIAAQNAMVDFGVGVIMETLERSGLDEETLVVYVSDHGFPYGHHGLWAAGMYFPQVLYEQNMNIPFIVRHTGSIEPDRVPDVLVSEYDIFPTILDYIGFGDVEIENSPGRSLASLLRGGPPSFEEDEVYFEHEESRGIRTSRYSYWKRLEGFGENELYDMVDDPNQDNNVYGQPEYEVAGRELDAKLVAFFERYSDPAYDEWKGGRAKLISYRTPMFQERYPGWEIDTELKPEFKE